MDDFTREYLKRKEENKGVKPQLIPSTSQTFQQVNQASQKQAQTIKQESAKQKASYNTLKQTSGADEARKEYERRISRLQQQKTELTAGLDLDGAARVQDQIDSMRREMNGVSRFESAVTGAIGTYLGSGINALGSLLSPLEKAGNRYSSKSMDAWKALVDNEGLNKRLEDQALTQQERAQIQQQIQRNLSSVELYRQARDNTPFVDSIQRTADLVTQRGTENIEKAKEGLGALGQFAVDTGVALGQYGLDIGAAAVTGGSAMVPMAIRSFGGAQQQARQAGASENQAALYGLASAGLEAATEKIGSVGRISSKFFGGGAIDDVMEGMVASLEKKARTQAGQAALNRIGTAAASFVSEGFEEFVSGVTSPLLERAIYSDDPLAFGEILGDALYDFAVGGAVGAIGGGLGGTDTSRFYNQDMPMADSRISEQIPGDTAQEIAQELSFYQGEEQASAEQKSQEGTREARENAIRRLLEEQGVTGTESAVQARALTSLLDGGEISGKQADAIVKSKAARDVYSQETGEEIDTSGTASEARNRLRQLAAERAAIQVAAQETGTTQVVEQARQEAAEPVQVQQEPRVTQTVAQDGTDLGRITVSAQNIQSVSRMAESSKVLGQAGKAVVSAMYTGETDPGLYVEGAMRAYQDGLNGKRSNVPTGLVRAQYNEIYRAAQQDMVREANPMTRTVTMTSKGGGLIQNRAAARLQDADLIDGLARRLGVKVVADETIMGPDGRQSAANGYIKDGVIHIALDAENPHMEVFKHEATHAIQEKGAKTYQTFRDYAVKLAGEAEVDRVLEQYRSSGVNLSREGAMDEVAADFAGKLLTDEKTVVRMIQDDRNLAQKFFDAIRDLIRRITKSGGQVNSELMRAEALWKKAFEEAGKQDASRGTMGTRYSAKEDAGNGRTREETREDFLQRAAGEGYAIYEGKTTAYGYRGPVHLGHETGAWKVREELQRLGINGIVTDGSVLWNRNGRTGVRQIKQAFTAQGEAIFINENVSIPASQVAGHEAFHLWRNRENRDTYIEAVEDNLLFTSEEFMEYQSAIAQAYLGGEADLSNDAQMEKLREELFAYISGDIHEGVNDDILRPMFRDYDAVKAAWEKLVTENSGESDIRFSLQRENKRLRELNQYLREEISNPDMVRTNRNAVKKEAGKILREYGSDYDRTALTDRMMALYDFIANGKDAQGNELTWSQVNEQATGIARDILDGAVAQGNPLYEEYSDVRTKLRSTKIKVDDMYRGDFGQFGGWGEFKKRNAGRIKFSNDGTPSDVVYQELTEMWPELFPEDIINPADQMLHTAEVMQYLSAVYENPYQEELDVYARYLADQILETFYQVPERRTYAQRQRLKQTRQTIKYEKRLSDLRERQKARVEELRRQGRDSVKRAVDAQKESSQKKLEALTKKYQSKEAAGRSSREAAATRAKILRHVNKMSQLLLRPSDKSHVPESLKKPVADLLSSINLESQYTVDPETGKRVKGGNGDPVKRSQAFQELKAAYKKIEETGEYLVDPDLQDNLDAVIAMREKKLADMTVEELGTVWKAVRAMEASISNANKLLARSRFEAVSDLANGLKNENSGKREKKNYIFPIGMIDGLVNLDMLTPQAYFHRLGDAGDELFRMMRRAADRQTEILKDAQDKTESFLNGIDARKLEKEMHTFQIGSDTLELSTAQIMELYALSRRKQAMDHIYLGGIRPAGARKGIVLVGSADPVHVEPSDVANIVSTLTDRQAQAVRDMQEYLSTTMSEYGNDASMRVYGYKKFLEKMYWPIRVDKNQTITDVTKEGAEKMVPQYGMTKQVTPNANNALLIGSIFDTYAQHITEMSIYSAWLPTWEDVSRVQNFTFRDPDTGRKTGTVKTMVTRVFGQNGNAYLTNLLKDVSQGTKASADTVFSIRGLTSAYKAAAVGANIRVILQQPTAGLRALDVLDPKYILEGLPKKGDWETVKKWAPIAQWKDWGYFEMDTGRAIKDVLLGTDSVLEKAKSLSMSLAGKADGWTWSKLWNACAAEIEEKRPNLEKGSDAYYRAVAERFNEVIDQTQVVDSVLSRTQLMRSSRDLTKMAASFMSEPSKVYNMFLNSVYDLRSASSSEAKAKARKRLGRTTVSLVVSFAVNAIAQSLIDAMRDDDREKKYWGKFADEYIKNFVNNFNPFGYVPYVKDIISLLSGYDVVRMDMESIRRVIDASNNVVKAMQGTGKYTVPSSFATLFLESSKLLGIPVANLKRDIKAIFMTTAIQSDNYLMQYRMDRASLNLNYQGNTGLFMDTLYNAMKTDRDAYEIIYDDLVKNGIGEDKIASAMETRMKADQGVESVEELEQRYLPPAQEKKYQASYNKISSSSLWAQASKEQRQELKNDLYTLITGDTKQAQSMLEDISGGAEYGVGQEEYLLFELAKEMASQDGNGHTNQSEALAAVDMVPGLSNEAKAYLWKETTVTGETPAWLDYESAAGAAGIDPWEYILFHEAYYNASSTKDENGKTIEGQSKQDHVRDWLQSSSFTREQQEFLWGTVYKSDY